MSPNETPWPGLNYCTADLMPGLRREFQKNDRLATHMLSVNCLYQMNMGIASGGFRDGRKTVAELIILGRIGLVGALWYLASMRDVDVRPVLKRRLDARYGTQADAIIVEELGICHGTVRADIAVINGSLKGYEIKSDRDTLTRLASQAEIYNKVFDTVTIVVADRHLERAARMIPVWWGIEVVRANALSKLRLCRIRKEGRNPGVDPFALVQLLWREEALSLLRQMSPSGLAANKPRRFFWQALAGSVPLSELKKIVRECLKSRKSWRFDEEQMQGDARSQPCATLSGSPYQQPHSRSRRYIHRPS